MNNNFRKALSFMLAFLLALGGELARPPSPANAAGIIFVDNTCVIPICTGASWNTAYPTLQDALAVATSGDQIWVASGTYYPDEGAGQTNNNRSSTFTLKSGVEIIGGFGGTETSLSQRNITSNLTILSGDIDKNDVVSSGGFTIIGSNAYHVVTSSATNSTAILDGFLIQLGQANGSAFDEAGGGILNIAGSPTLRNLDFYSNTGFYGGGILNLSGSNPALSNVNFTSNKVTYYGGGMYNIESSPELTNMTFNSNSANTSGGGIYNQKSNPTLTNGAFNSNSAGNGGGGMANSESSPTLKDIIFSGNISSSSGGGMLNFIGSAPLLTNVTFLNNGAIGDGGGMYNFNSNPTLVNLTFSANSADNNGGGMYNAVSNSTLINVTFSNNSALTGGGLYNNNSIPTLKNTIIANSSLGGDCVNFNSSLNLASTNNLIESSGSNACGITNGVNGNIIGSDPNLASLTGSPGYHPLNSGSPAIDAGDDVICAAAPVNNTSQNGVTRPQGANCDIGSFEFPTLTLRSVAANDGFVLESTETSGVGGTLDAVAVTFNLGDDAADKQYRAILHFNTSSLPDTAVITKATLKIKKQGQVGTNPFTLLGGLRVDMRTPSFGAVALAIGDFQAVAGRTSVATFGVTPVSNWYSAVLNGSGRNYVNKTGATQFRLLFATDDNNDNGADHMLFHSGNAPAASRPQLIIEYMVP